MGKKNGKIKIQEEREKRQANIAQLNAWITNGQKQLGEWQAALLKNIGALEQLDELEGIKPEASNNGAPEKKKVSEKKEK